MEGNLVFKNENNQSVRAYTKLDWAGILDDRKYTSGYFTFFGGNLVT